MIAVQQLTIVSQQEVSQVSLSISHSVAETVRHCGCELVSHYTIYPLAHHHHHHQHPFVYLSDRHIHQSMFAFFHKFFVLTVANFIFLFFFFIFWLMWPLLLTLQSVIAVTITKFGFFLTVNSFTNTGETTLTYT